MNPVAQKPTNPYRSLVVGMIVIVIGLGGFLYWAMTAPLSAGAYAPGRLRVETQSKQVQHLEGGIVSAIHVREGDYVSKGDELLTLDNTELKAVFLMNRSEFEGSLARIARLEAELAQEEDIEFPQNLMIQARNPRVRQILETQKMLFKARVAQHKGNLSVYERQLETNKQRIEGLRGEAAAAAEQIRYIDEMLKSQQSLKTSGYSAQTAILELKKDRAEIRQNRAQALTGIRTTEADIQETLVRIESEKLNYQKEILDELEKLRHELPAQEERFIAAKMKLRRTSVVAPSDGAVVGMIIHTVGGVVSPRESIMAVVPAEERLIIEAQVRPEDVERVAPKSMASVRFSSLNTRTTPVLLGEVKTVSADLLTDQNTGEPYYETTVIVPADELEKLANQKLVPGMPVEVIIESGQRTALEYLIKPISDVVAKAFLE